MSTELTTVEPVVHSRRTFQPETGYYRITTDHENSYYRDCGFVAGELAYVYAGKDAYHVFIGEHEWKYDYATNADSFDKDFEFVPNGSELRQKQIADLMAEISTTNINMIQTRKSIIGFSPHVENNGELSTSTKLVPAGTDMQTVKRAVAEVRNTTMKAKKDLTLKTKRLELMIKEQSRALAIKVKEMTEMVEKMEEAIWTINLYLGKNEEIHILRKGHPAKAEDKITIRQSLLYMDEECAIAARSGGIGIESIEEFDEWILKNPTNLERVLPEHKGIIALHIKREGKDYGNPWLSAQMNDANLGWTYFLIRNGENVYRVYVDINVGVDLFPNRDEFEDFFWTEETDWDDPAHPIVRKPLKPGSDAYMKAMDAAEEWRKHYLRVALVLQGLIDRTPIFQPMPTDRINLCDPRHCKEWLNLIYDKERVLTDGKPTFREWQSTVNNKLEVGHRIIGIFDHSSRIRGNERNYEPCRIYPRTASYPNSNVLHTIEDREGEKYIIRYERTGETIYRRDESWWSGKERVGEPEVRARCWVEKSDRFILNFDATTVEEMKYYIDHRLSRHDYKDMVPLLDAAIKLKKAEIEEEAPFRMMLVGQIMQRYGVSHFAAEEKLDELVKWWKFKNRTHRALLSDDIKAVTMIVAEFGIRRKQESIRERVQSVRDGIIAIIAGQEPAPIMIAHKSDNKYVAYVPHNDQNIWVTEQTWSHNRQTGIVGIREAKQWKLVDKRHERWEILYQHPRWTEWRTIPPMSDVLTDPELQMLVAGATAKLEAKFSLKKADGLKRADSDFDSEQEKAQKAGHIRFMPLCVYHNSDFEIVFWYSDIEPIVPTTNVISTHSEAPSVGRVKVLWKRTAKEGVVLERYFGDESHYSYNPSSPPWKKDYMGNEVNCRILQKWDNNIETLAKEFKLVREHEKLVSRLSATYDYVVRLVADQMYETKVAAARKEFDIEYGDPELWDDHLKSLKIRRIDPQYLDDIFHWFLERDINPVGWTLRQVYETAHETGYFEHTRRSWHGRDELIQIPNDIPMSFVVPPPPPADIEEEVEEENDD